MRSLNADDLVRAACRIASEAEADAADALCTAYAWMHRRMGSKAVIEPPTGFGNYDPISRTQMRRILRMAAQ